MATKPLSSKDVKAIEIDVKKARLQNMVRESTKSFAIILTMLIRDSLNKKK